MATTTHLASGMATTTHLASGGVLLVSRRRAALTLGSTGWSAISSAVYNGGVQTFPGVAYVLNAKVPADYDGLTPEPAALLKRLAEEEGLDADTTVGLLTAASMGTLRTASRTADGVTVDVIVTAGISNSRAAGAAADFFGFDDADAGADAAPGTINTVVLTNATLSAAALVEAHSIAVEAKCASCAELGLRCAKTAADLAQGTGTDTTVLLSAAGGRRVCYAGKHTLL